MDLDLTGIEKLEQISLLSECFHSSELGLMICRSDGRFALANATIGRMLNIPEVAFDNLRIHDLVVRPDDRDGKFAQEFSDWYEKWFAWPLITELPPKNDVFKIYGWSADGADRVSYDSIVTVKPIYARSNRMVVIASEENVKTLFALVSVKFPTNESVVYNVC